jgi:hypothetical protein
VELTITRHQHRVAPVRTMDDLDAARGTIGNV